jgi:4-amino-4-deoxy-L-arabinose transferase-like glycosyltransferase
MRQITQQPSYSSANPGIWFLIPIILLFGMALLLPGLADFDFWGDEGWTAVTAQQDTLADVVDAVSRDYHPPLYFVLVHLWQKLAGDTILAFRYLSIMTVLLTGTATYRLAQSLFGRKAAVLAVTLYLLHDLVLVLGQEARPYPQAQLCSVLVMWQYWRFWNKPTFKRGLLFVLTGASLLWTLYWGGFLLLALGVHALMTRLKQLHLFILANLGIGLLFLPWVPTLLNMLDRTPYGLNHTLPATQYSYRILAFQLLGTPEAFWAILAILGVVSIRSWRPTAASSMPALVLGITVGVSIIINLEYQSLSFRSLSIVIPALVMLIAHALAGFRTYEARVVVGIAVAISLTTTASQVPERVTTFRPLVDFMIDHSTPNDVILAEIHWDSFPMVYYINRRPDPLPYRINHLEVRTARSQREDFATYMRNQLTDFDAVWLVQMENFQLRYDTLAILASDGFVPTVRMIWEDDFIPVQLTRFDRLPQAAPVVTFGEIMQLAGVNIAEHYHGVSVNLLWTPLESPQYNYTTSVFLLDSAGQLVVQHDSYPMNDFAPTTQWLPDQYYYDSYFLPTSDLPAGTYQVGVQVYTLTNELAVEPVFPEGCNDLSCRFIILDTITID